MARIILILMTCVLFSCTPQKHIQQVPVNNISKIEYRDRPIYVRDTVYIQVPAEEKETTTKRDSSHLETSVAISDAWIDDNGLNHNLRNKKTQLKTVRDTVYINQTITEYKEKEVLKEVPVDVPYIPKWCWYSLIANAIVATYIITKLVIKFKKLV